MEYFQIQGGKRLSGEVTVNTSKNAAVALLAASLINKGITTLKNVPQIEEVNRWVEVLESMNVKIEKKGRDFIITPPKEIAVLKIDKKAAEKTRSAILLLGSLAPQIKEFNIPQAGGCRLGSRTVRPHVFALENFGIIVESTVKNFNVKTEKFTASKKIVLYESSDTVTENVLCAAAQSSGTTIIHMASGNYMVQDVCFYLQKLGIKIKGIGTSTLEITGKDDINKNIVYEISEDPIEAMFFISVALTTKSEFVIKRAPIDFLELELLKLEKMGMNYSLSQTYKAKNGKTKLVDIHIKKSNLSALEEKIHSLPYPGINIDNLPFFIPIAIATHGRTLIHDWVFEERLIYAAEINRLGASMTLLDPHRMYIDGPSKLRGTEMVCPPALRPAVIVLVTMLAAKGQSRLRSVYQIQRGYENLEERLQKLGAEISLINEEK